MPITLTVIRGPEIGRQFTFVGPGTFLIGRSTRSQFVLPSGDVGDLRVSHTHCLVEFSPLGCRVHDLNSHNGTFLNGQKVATVDLTDGAELRVGQTVMRVDLTPDTQPETVDWHGDIYQAATIPPAAPPASAKSKPHPRPVRASSTPKAPATVCPACRAPGQLGKEPICQRCMAAAAAGEQPFPGYRLICEVGRGAMGVVYLAWHELDACPVAMKTIHPAMALKQTQVERFVREAGILKQLDHPHIVGFREAGYAEGSLFLAMEFVHGKNAATAVQDHKRIAEPIAVSLTCQLLQALEYAHGKRFVHRDLKPANMLLRATASKSLEVKLADFGLARVYEASQLSGVTGTNDVGGTTAFMPPEQVLDYRNVKPPTDQYAASACLYTMLTGQFVYDQPSGTARQFKQILDEDPVPILDRKPDVNPDLAEAIMTALSRDPADRFPDVKAFRRAIQPFAG